MSQHKMGDMDETEDFQLTNSNFEYNPEIGPENSIRKNFKLFEETRPKNKNMQIVKICKFHKKQDKI